MRADDEDLVFVRGESEFRPPSGMMWSMHEMSPIRTNRDVSAGEAGAFALNDLDYDLPDELIARTPAVRRDAARMLTVDRRRDTLSDRTVSDLPGLLEPGDLLVLNDTRVIPARFTARRGTGGIVRGLFLDEPQRGVWHVMLEGSRRLRVAETLIVGATSVQTGFGKPTHVETAGPSERGGQELEALRSSGPAAQDVAAGDNVVRMELAERRGEGHWLVRVASKEPAADILERFGETPLPPYIGRKADRPDPDSADRERYQTVYAASPGAVAAPTAGLHFTHDMLDAIRRRGVETAFVTLHVGLGTFKPITVSQPVDHQMHREWFELSESAAEAINACRGRGGRVVAVGTTSVRVLETAASALSRSVNTPMLLEPCRGWSDLFIYPPYRFAYVDALLTNFHLPRSTLLALVMALAGVGLTRRAYDHAIAECYRFYSYGDAMLIV